MNLLIKTMVASWLLILANSVSAQTERDVILNNGDSHVASWAYYTDPVMYPTVPRWYISQIESGKVDVYSLGRIVNHQAGWWTVAQAAATINMSGNLVSIDPGLDNDASNSFYDVGLQQWLSNSSIHSDRQGVQGTTVPIKWFFFNAPNGRWYIVNAPGYGATTQILLFNELNGQYDWQTTDTADFVPAFSNSGGAKSVSFYSSGMTTTLIQPIVGSLAVVNEGRFFDVNYNNGVTRYVNGVDQWRQHLGTDFRAAANTPVVSIRLCLKTSFPSREPAG